MNGSVEEEESRVNADGKVMVECQWDEATVDPMNPASRATMLSTASRDSFVFTAL